jgi:hypothetical protein
MGVAQPVAIPKTVGLSHQPHQPPEANPDSVTITVNDSVKWECAEDFVVVFENNETPFDSWYFFPGQNVSGLPRRDVKHDYPYKYTVHIGGDKHDPNVIIKP